MKNLQQFLEKCPCPVVGVSGGEGRKTVSKMVYLMMKEAERDVYLGNETGFEGGNADEDQAGYGVDRALDKLNKESWVVLDLAAMDLKDVTVSPHVAVIVGEADAQEDLDALVNFVKLQKAEDFSVVSLDRPYGEKLQAESGAQKFPVSRTQAVTHGAHIEGPAIIFCAPGVCQMAGNVNKVLLKGENDQENILAAVAVARVLQIPIPAIQKVLYTFEGDGQR
ncbi:hypothetical protein IT413_02640 [Candidatus Peregrinibacteria bacterium]|nr:hypothetical protein [Candidatus Peregrinibacteria bacterium]